jgi:hypothetical protein
VQFARTADPGIKQRPRAQPVISQLLTSSELVFKLYAPADIPAIYQKCGILIDALNASKMQFLMRKTQL